MHAWNLQQDISPLRPQLGGGQTDKATKKLWAEEEPPAGTVSSLFCICKGVYSISLMHFKATSYSTVYRKRMYGSCCNVFACLTWILFVMAVIYSQEILCIYLKYLLDNTTQLKTVKTTCIKSTMLITLEPLLNKIKPIVSVFSESSWVCFLAVKFSSCGRKCCWKVKHSELAEKLCWLCVSAYRESVLCQPA